ncbi:retrovirus-related pol polyprotein from transposon TNT 1-94 [Tanacetum coccineum]
MITLVLLHHEIRTTSGGGVDQRLVAAVCQEMMRMFKGKGGDNGISRDHASTSRASILSYCTTSFAPFCHPHMNIKEDWKKDTWASDHMTPNFNLFISITHPKKLIIVHLPDGNSKTVTIMGKVLLTPSLILINVFYNPEFQFNLLSVGQLTQNHNLSAHFYSKDCCFQDPSTKQIVAVGKGSKCLYICKPTLDPVAFATDISKFQAFYLNCIPSVSFHKESFSNTVSNCSGSHGVLHQRSIAHTPQHNGRVERKHRHLLDTARALRLHVKVLDWQSSFEKLYGKPPTYDHLRVIGCLCYAADIRPHKDKFANKGIKSVLIGYLVNQKGYKLYNWETKEVFLSRDVVFEETIFPFKKVEVPTNPQSTPTYPTFETHCEISCHVSMSFFLEKDPLMSK